MVIGGENHDAKKRIGVLIAVLAPVCLACSEGRAQSYCSSLGFAAFPSRTSRIENCSVPGVGTISVTQERGVNAYKTPSWPSADTYATATLASSGTGECFNILPDPLFVCDPVFSFPTEETNGDQHTGKQQVENRFVVGLGGIPLGCGVFGQGSRYAKDVRRASHVVPVKWIHGSRANFYQDFIVPSGRPFDVFKLKNIGRTIVAINDGFHEGLSEHLIGSFSTWFATIFPVSLQNRTASRQPRRVFRADGCNVLLGGRSVEEDS